MKAAVWAGLLAGLLGLAACGGDGVSPVGGEPARIALVTGNGQIAPVRSPVPEPPAVRVTDAGGRPVAGVRVQFEVTQGGGTVEHSSVVTGEDGIARAGAWVLGPAIGAHTLVATVDGLGMIEFRATAIPGPPSVLATVSSASQTGEIGQPVAVSPSVRVEDAFGNGIPGVTVAFTVTSGGGTLTGDTVETDLNGIATSGSWSLGPLPGINTVVAEVIEPGVTVNSVQFTAVASSTEYSIDLRYLSSVTASQRQAFTNAADRLTAIITGDVPDITVNLAADACLAGQPALSNARVDDLVIFAEVVAIDGPGGILGRAGPCLIRGNTSLPIVGVMQFDAADLASLEMGGALGLVILHEMMHVLGFGTIWQAQGLLAGSGTNDPVFTGPNAVTAFLAAGGISYSGRPVPVENSGAPGTLEAHWRESVFQNELMTGFLNPGNNPLSVITAAQFTDLGYTVNQAAADPFTLVSPFPGPGVTGAGSVPLGNDIWQGPLYRAAGAGLQRIR